MMDESAYFLQSIDQSTNRIVRSYPMHEQEISKVFVVNNRTVELLEDPSLTLIQIRWNFDRREYLKNGGRKMFGRVIHECQLDPVRLGC